MGAVGAVAGALLGAAVIVMLNQMGTYAAFAGFLLAVAVVYGYDLLGKRRGTAGTVIVTLLLLCVPYLAHTLCWALMISASTDVTYPLLYGIALFYALLNDGHIDLAMYLLELLVLYGFVAMGAVLAFARSAARQKKLSGKM